MSDLAVTTHRSPLTLLALVALVAGCAPPRTSAQAGTDEARLWADVEALAHDSMQGRAAGTEGGRMAREFLVRRLGEIGLDAVRDTFPLDRDAGEGINVLTTVRGTEHPDRYLVITAHYDHLGVRDGEIYNGADDNASGTAALLALAAMVLESPPRHSVLLAFLDAEEGGLQGARHLVASPPVPLDRVLLNLNLDMVGHSDGELWVVGTTQYPFLKPVVETVSPAPPVFLRFGHDTEEDRGADNWVMASDHAAFHREGIPFLYFGVSDHPDYHRPTDDVETLGRDFYPAAVATIARIVEAFDRTLEGVRPAE